MWASLTPPSPRRPRGRSAGFADEVAPGDPQGPRRPGAVAPVRLEGLGEHPPLQLRHRLREAPPRGGPAATAPGAADPRREELLVDARLVAREDHQPLDLVLQLPDVPRPGVGRQAPEGPVGEALAPPAGGGVALEEVVHQDRQVLEALAQGRQAQGDDVEAVVEVLAEGAGGDPLREVPVGGGDDADVDRHGPGVAHGRQHALLEHPEEAHLEARGGVTDLVEEEGAPVGDLEQALLVGDGAGEAPPAVAEELALQERRRQGRAVEDHEGPERPGAVVVDGPGHQLLAGAVLPGDQHRGVGTADLLHQGEEPVHGVALAHQGLEARAPGAGGRGQAPGPTRRLGAVLEDFADHQGHQLLEVVPGLGGERRGRRQRRLHLRHRETEAGDLVGHRGPGGALVLGGEGPGGVDRAQELAVDAEGRRHHREPGVAAPHHRLRVVVLAPLQQRHQQGRGAAAGDPPGGVGPEEIAQGPGDVEVHAGHRLPRGVRHAHGEAPSPVDDFPEATDHPEGEQLVPTMHPGSSLRRRGSPTKAGPRPTRGGPLPIAGSPGPRGRGRPPRSRPCDSRPSPGRWPPGR